MDRREFIKLSSAACLALTSVRWFPISLTGGLKVEQAKIRPESNIEEIQIERLS